MASGSQHNLYIVPETKDGETPANAKWAQLRNTGTTLKQTTETIVSEEIRADRQISGMTHGVPSIAGDISGEMSFKTYDLLLEAALLGTWDKDMVKTGVKRRSFSVLRHHTDITDKPYMLFTGVQVGGFALSMSTDGKVGIVFNCIGRGGQLLSSLPAGSALGESTTTPIFNSFRGSASVGGQSSSILTEASVELNNNMNPRNVLFSASSLSPSVGRSDAKLQVSAYFENAKLIETYLNETEIAISFDLVDSLSNKLTFSFPRCKLEANMPEVTGEDDIILSTPVQALLDPIKGTNVIIERKAV